MDRRELIQWMISTGGLAAFQRMSARDLESLGAAVHRQANVEAIANSASTVDDATHASQGRVLDASATRTVTIAAELIIPRTDTPGATQAGVAAFIETMMAGWYSPVDRQRFLSGLSDLDARSRARTSTVFAQASHADQVALLEAVDQEVSALRRARSTSVNDHWFAMLKYLTVWGYCTSEVGMRDTLHSYPPPMRYDGAASA